jgi:hypothetical protein
MQENSQPLTESVTTPATDDDPAYEAIPDSSMSFPKEEIISSQNTFHAEFPPLENGFTSSEESKSGQDVPESFGDSDKFSIPGADESQLPDVKQIPFNAFGDISSPADARTDFETSQNEKTGIGSEESIEGEFTPISIELEDMSTSSKKIENQPPANPSIEAFSLFESEKQSDSDTTNVETETCTPTAETTSVTRASFEVNFETENEDEKSSTPNQQDMFVFNAGSDAFSGQDPFTSAGPTEFEQSAFNAFPDDDPFSPSGASNLDTNSDPFAENDNLFAVENDNPFAADFSDVPTGNVDIPDETNSENDRNSNKDEDIFEVMFEAKLEEQFENESSSKDKNEDEELNMQQSEVDFNHEQSSHDTNAELENREEEIAHTTEEAETAVTLPNKNTTEPVEDEGLNTLSKEITEVQHEDTNKKNTDVNNANTFDFSSDDVYVTLASAVPAPQSPTEFSPPPLPPRPMIPKEPIDTIVSPKIPPALPPRPTINQAAHEETNIRKPPELPPRPDLEESGLIENELVNTVQEPVSFSNDNSSPMFEANFATFDFDDIEKNSPAKNVGTPTAGFDSNDPFKDPFAGADPFQTPIAGDPFASSTSFDAGDEQNSDDPFSGDDPFAMTPAFDASFGSPFNTNVQSSDEPNDNEQKDQVKFFQ